GDEKQDGPELRDRDRLQPPGRTLCRSASRLSLLLSRPPDEPRVLIAGNLRRGGVRLHHLPDQRRRRNQLDRRRAAALRLPDPRDSFLLPPRIAHRHGIAATLS